MGIEGFINGLTKFTQTISAVQGAADALAPAIQTVDRSLNQVAQVFSGDTYYNPYPAYPVYPVYPPMPIGTPEQGKVGMVGKILAGGIAGGVTYQQTGDAFKAIKAGQTGPGFKTLGISMLKAGGIGAGVSGVISIAKNLSLVSKGMQTNADAGGNIAADTVGGLLAGATGGLTAGAAGLALSAMGVAGLPLTIGAVAAGALGAVGADMIFQTSGARDNFAMSIRRSLGGY